VGYWSAYLVGSALLRLALAWWFLYLWLPGRLFPFLARKRGLERWVAGACLMLFANITLVYLLAVTRLYEVASVVGCWVIVFLVVRYRRGGYTALREDARSALGTILEVLDGVRHPVRTLKGSGTGLVQAVGDALSRRSLADLVFFAAALGTAAGAAYLRFRSALVHPAPAMSDAYVVLAWMKYVEARQLFRDGVYPLGLEIYLSLLRKFSALDGLLVLNLAGPLCGLLVCVTLYLVVSRVLEDRWSGLLAAFAYGVMGPHLAGEFVRQAATNSQEFGMIFVLPAAWWTYRYLQGGQSLDLWLAAATCALSVYIHPMTALYTALAVGTFSLAAALVHRCRLGQLLKLAGACLMGALVGALPLLLAMGAGIPLHASSAEFATRRAALTPPRVTPRDLAAGALLGVGCLVSLSGAGRRWRGVWTLAGLAAAAAALWQAPRWGMQSVALAVRSGEFWSLALCGGLGVAGGLCRGLFGRREVLCALVVVAGMAYALQLWPVQPAEPYRLQWDSEVAQYLRIASEFRPTEWLIVSFNEGYALALGRGWHMQASTLVEEYDPRRTVVGLGMEGDGLRVIPVPDVFIFVPHQLYPLPIEELRQEWEARQETLARLKEWVRAYQEVRDDMTVYYADHQLVVYRISRPLTPEQRFRRIWGEPP